jgi:hypothetical protein
MGLPGIGGGGYRRTGPVLTPLQRFGADLAWHYEIGESEIDTQVVATGELPNHARATRLGDLSDFGRDLLYPSGEQPATAGDHWPYCDADGGLNNLPRIYGGTVTVNHWMLRRAVDIPAGTELAVWCVFRIVTAIAGGPPTEAVHRRVWGCSGTSALSTTGGRTGFSCSSNPCQVRFETITDGGSQEATNVASTLGRHVAAIVYRAGLAPHLYLDGALVGTAPGSGGVAALTHLGFGSTGVSQASDGFMFLGVPRAITEYERQQVGRYITQQTGLAA